MIYVTQYRMLESVSESCFLSFRLRLAWIKPRTPVGLVSPCLWVRGAAAWVALSPHGVPYHTVLSSGVRRVCPPLMEGGPVIFLSDKRQVQLF